MKSSNIEIKTSNDGFTLSVFGLGTWMMGGRFSRDPNNNDERDIRAIRRALKQGITHIDTAELYAAGHAEELVGQAIKELDRSSLFIVSKVWDNHLKYDDLITAAKNSLVRLGTDYLDLYLIHKPNPNVPLRETMKAMDTLLEQGMIRNIGVSNFTIERIQEAQSYTKNKIVATQVHYNLMYREPELKGVLRYCQENDIFLIAWRPVEKGVLATGEIRVVDEMCTKYSKSPAQIAINWLISQHKVVTLSTMRSPEHLQENLGALGWKMSEEDIELIREHFPNQQKISNRVPLS